MSDTVIKGRLSVNPGGLVVTIYTGTPPFEVYLGNTLLAKSEQPVIAIPFDTKGNIAKLELSVKDGTGESFNLIPGPALDAFNPYELGFLLTIARKQHQILTSRGGFEAILRKRKKWGAPCPKCQEEVGPPPEIIPRLIDEHIAADPRCPVCFGTGYQGGYWGPITILANYFNPQHIVLDANETVRYNQLTLQLEGGPIIEKDDVLILPVLGNRVYRVVQTKQNEYKGVVINQIATAEELPEGSILTTMAFAQTFEITEETEGDLGISDSFSS